MMDFILPHTHSETPLLYENPRFWKVIEIEWDEEHNGAESCLIAMPAHCLKIKRLAKPPCGVECKARRREYYEIGSACDEHGCIIRLPYQNASEFERFCPSLFGAVPNKKKFEKALGLCMQSTAVIELDLVQPFH